MKIENAILKNLVGTPSSRFMTLRMDLRHEVYEGLDKFTNDF